MAAALPDWMIMAEVHDSLSFEGEEIDVAKQWTPFRSDVERVDGPEYAVHHTNDEEWSRDECSDQNLRRILAAF